MLCVRKRGKEREKREGRAGGARGRTNHAFLFLTSVLGEQHREGALLQQARRVVLLGELGDVPVVDAVVVPGLGLVVLCEEGREREKRERGGGWNDG